ncbi:hypothetical protein B0T19DRAFT_102066 [Cercophora scortea]|uniref:Uncharacterized protein n=1 Tax=Cercophora scortea TaxID=314031 RepID=A0AAE0IXM1_9PEZI|nr:hypothetical protein B0T19DRAFT_102066 [Cercophora scortea]
MWRPRWRQVRVNFEFRPNDYCCCRRELERGPCGLWGLAGVSSIPKSQDDEKSEQGRRQAGGQARSGQPGRVVGTGRYVPTLDRVPSRPDKKTRRKLRRGEAGWELLGDGLHSIEPVLSERRFTTAGQLARLFFLWRAGCRDRLEIEGQRERGGEVSYQSTDIADNIDSGARSDRFNEGGLDQI